MQYTHVTPSRNRRRKSTPFSGAGFFVPYTSGIKLMAPKIDVAKNDVDDEFAEEAAPLLL